MNIADEFEIFYDYTEKLKSTKDLMQVNQKNSPIAAGKEYIFTKNPTLLYSGMPKKNAYFVDFFFLLCNH